MPKRFYTALAALLVILMALSFLPVHGEDEINNTVIRLHVPANSDSEEDQALKLKVRDAVLEVTADCLSAADSRDTAQAAPEDKPEDVRLAAESVIAAEDAFMAVGLTKDQYGIITETGRTTYKIRFKILELWHQ